MSFCRYPERKLEIVKIDQNISELITSNCDVFAIDAYKNAAIEEAHNFVFSPFGAQVVLTILASGADGNTKSEMYRALRLPNNDDEVLKGFHTAISNINNLSEIDAAVGVANVLSHTLNVKPQYLEAIEKYFPGSCSVIDFSDKAKSAEVINTWCAKATKDNIQKIVTEDDFSEMTALLLLNTIYFKAEWKHQFCHAHTKWNTFHLNETETTRVPYMYQENEFFHGEFKDLDVQFLELPYKDEKSKMVVLLPNKITGLSELEHHLDKINYERFMTCRTKKTVDLFLPKFCFETTIELNECLKKMGMQSMFTNNANFGKITDDRIKTVKVLQKSFIAIDENGTVAATVTESLMEYCCLLLPFSTIFRADRPFMVMIMCDDLPLFYAKFVGEECQYKWTLD